MQMTTMFRLGASGFVATALGLLILGCNGSSKSTPSSTAPGTSVYLQDTSAKPQEDPNVRVTIDRATVNTDQGALPLTLAGAEGQTSTTLNLADLRAGSALIATGAETSGATAESVTFTVIRAETTNPATGMLQPLALEQTEVTAPLAAPTPLGARTTLVVDVRPEVVNGGLRLVPGLTSISTTVATPTPTDPTTPATAPTPTSPSSAPGVIIEIDDEGESPYSPNNLNSNGNLNVADMETPSGSNNWIICVNRPPLETVGPEDTQYTAENGLVYDGGTFDNPTGAPGNGAGVPEGAVLGTVADFMQRLRANPASP